MRAGGDGVGKPPAVVQFARLRPYPFSADLIISWLEYIILMIRTMTVVITISCSHLRLIRLRGCSGVQTASQVQIEGGNG